MIFKYTQLRKQSFESSFPSCQAVNLKMDHYYVAGRGMSGWVIMYGDCPDAACPETVLYIHVLVNVLSQIPLQNTCCLTN